MRTVWVATRSIIAGSVGAAAVFSAVGGLGATRTRQEHAVDRDRKRQPRHIHAQPRARRPVTPQTLPAENRGDDDGNNSAGNNPALTPPTSPPDPGVQTIAPDPGIQNNAPIPNFQNNPPSVVSGAT